MQKQLVFLYNLHTVIWSQTKQSVSYDNQTADKYSYIYVNAFT